MKRSLLLIALIITTITSCERDDICIDETTPNLILKFLDAADENLTKGVSGLEIVYLESDFDTLSGTGDSIFIPLRIDSDTTKYKLTNQITTDDIRVDTIVVSYEREEVFVGRACGFKMVFNNIKIESSTTNWIQDIETVENPQNIENETTAHITISH
ncbi:MAG: DUF6452 family protein [Flavobacteriaceae bacterium]|nr:DUF6452 family protein [Flavobacteriaceae bacterium]